MALLSLLALLVPDLTLAPLHAGEPRFGGPRPIDEVLESLPPRGVRPVDGDQRTAGGVLPPRTAPSVVDPARYQAALDAARSAAGAYGVTFAAVRDGELLWTGSSGRSRDGGRLEPDTPLVIGSVTKTFVAATVLQLVEEGGLSLDDSVRHLLPELTDLDERITVRQLLDHTSGLADLFNDSTRRGLEEHPEHAWTADEVLETLHAPWYEPGEGWAYANTNYYLLGLIVERLTGRTLAEELGRRFLGPLELSATRMLGGSVDDPLEPAWATIFWASGAMSSSASDLARWGDALYRDGILSAASRAAMFDANDHDYGLGVQEIDVGGTIGYGHTGLLNTFTTVLFHLPKDDVTLAMLVNRSHVDLGGMLADAPDDGASLLELATRDGG